MKSNTNHIWRKSIFMGAILCGVAILLFIFVPETIVGNEAETEVPKAEEDPAALVVTPESLDSEVVWKGESFYVLFADLNKVDVDLVFKDDSGNQLGSLGAAAAFVSKKVDNQKVLFATNAGMFKPDRSPVGLHIANGEILSKLDKRKKQPGNFYMQPNGVFFIDDSGLPGILETDQFTKKGTNGISLATQSGPMLVIDGKMHPAFNKGSASKYVRSGVGVVDESTIAFAISKRPVNFYTFGSLFRDFLKSKNALYLDGAISNIHAPDAGLNNPNGSYGGILVVSEKTE